MNEFNRPMPVYKHDRIQYLQEMARWHQALAAEPGSEGVFHSQRAQSYLDMLQEPGADPSVNQFY